MEPRTNQSQSSSASSEELLESQTSKEGPSSAIGDVVVSSQALTEGETVQKIPTSPEELELPEDLKGWEDLVFERATRLNMPSRPDLFLQAVEVVVDEIRLWRDNHAAIGRTSENENSVSSRLARLVEKQRNKDS
jgi:hypothetical protein